MKKYLVTIIYLKVPTHHEEMPPEFYCTKPYIVKSFNDFTAKELASAKFLHSFTFDIVDINTEYLNKVEEIFENVDADIDI